MGDSSRRTIGTQEEEEEMQDSPIPGYRYLVTNPDRLGGKPTIKGTRFSVSFILSCLSEGMSYDDIVRDYSEFPRESLSEALRFAAEVTDRRDVAA
jgi:uncharacterized protein (DUF433 family)